MVDKNKIKYIFGSVLIFLSVYFLSLYVISTYMTPVEGDDNIEEDNLSSINNLTQDFNLTQNFTHPNMYINTDDIKFIKDKVRSNQEPWKTAYDNMIKNADDYLDTPIQSVTFGGETPPSKDNHDYYTGNLYITDGIPSSKSDRKDYVAASKMAIAVRNLGMAYTFTGDSIYADKAIQLINAWTVRPSTKMNPTFTNGQSQIDITMTMPGMFYGADLIWNYPGWNIGDKMAFKSWTVDMIRSAKKWYRHNNFENWRLVFISSASVIAEDSSNLQYAFNRWKDIIPNQMNLDGSMKQEITRVNSLSYSTFALNAMMQTAEIARHHGIDLYNYKLKDGRGLEKALDFHAPYIVNPQDWIYPQMNDYKGEGAAIYELAYSFEQKSAYKSVIDKWGRPMYDTRIMGPITLTHAVTSA